jgi:hypothetical protein
MLCQEELCRVNNNTTPRGDLGLDRKLLLAFFLEIHSVKVRTEFFWLRSGSVAGF